MRASTAVATLCFLLLGLLALPDVHVAVVPLSELQLEQTRGGNCIEIFPSACQNEEPGQGCPFNEGCAYIYEEDAYICPILDGDEDEAHNPQGLAVQRSVTMLPGASGFDHALPDPWNGNHPCCRVIECIATGCELTEEGEYVCESDEGDWYAMGCYVTDDKGYGYCPFPVGMQDAGSHSNTAFASMSGYNPFRR